MEIDIDREIQRLLPLVQKPSRYIGGELNLIGKDPESVRIKVALAFPEVYEIGMSHLGIKILYHLINSRDDALADRVFTPWVDMESELRSRSLPLWGLETKLPLDAFDVVGFSLMHELMYSNVLTILDLGKIPLNSEDRSSLSPLVIAGGPCASNPEPMAPFVDAFVIGEGEEAIGEIVEFLASAKLEVQSREKKLIGLAGIEGIYVPRFYQPVYTTGGEYAGLNPIRSDVPTRIRKRFPTQLRDSFYPEAPLVPLSRIVQDRLDIELFRGCTRGCRFCHAGYFYRPVREKELEAVLGQVRSGLHKSGWEEFGLLSLSTSDYTCIERLLESLKDELSRENVSCSLPSLRIDNFSPSISGMVSGIKRTGLTFAPEAGTERLRKVINKDIVHEKILETARIAYYEGWNLIKCYFMIGLPTETQSDIDGLVGLALEIYNVGKGIDRNNRLNVSIGSFVPKPHTPFQWESFCPEKELRDKIRYIKTALHGRGIKVKWHSVSSSFLEALFSRGDRRMASVLQEAWSLGARFDEWTERFMRSTWEEAMERCDLNAEGVLRERSEEEPLPWDHIDLLIRKNHLKDERKKSLLAQTTEDCRWSRCNACGIPGAPDDILLSERRKSSPLHSKSPMTKTPQAELNRTRHRLIYQKGRPVRFLSHLDVIQLFMRSFRAAGLPVVFTRGRSPRPKISAGPPLPTGLIGSNELLDIFLNLEGELDVAGSIRPYLPNGLDVTASFPLPAGSKSPSSLLVWGDYEALLLESIPASFESISAAVEKFKLEETHTVIVSRKGKRRTVDLKKAVRNVVISSGPPISFSFLSKLLDMDGNTASPLLVLKTLFSFSREALAGVEIARKSLLTADFISLVDYCTVNPDGR
jgi:radical SAM family uncharacterized protein/radical SAM-linked protein